VHSLSGNESFLSQLVPVGVTENNTGKGSTTARVVNDVLYDTPDVTIAFSKVKSPKTGRVFVVVGMGFEDGVRSPLCSNDPTHLCELKERESDSVLKL